MQPHQNDDLRRVYRTTAIIGIVMIASLLIYAVVVEVIKKQHEPFGGYAPMGGDSSMLRNVLLGVVALDFFAIRFLNKLILTGKAPDRNSATVSPIPPEAQRLMVASIVTFALCESVAVYGLVLFLIQGDSCDFYLFLLLSLFYYSVFFPRYGKWEEWVKVQEREQSRKPLS